MELDKGKIHSVMHHLLHLVWWMVVAIYLLLFLLGLPLFYQQMSTLPPEFEFVGSYRTFPAAEIRTELARARVAPQSMALLLLGLNFIFSSGYLVIGGMLYWHKRHQRIGWISSLLLIAFGCGSNIAIMGWYPYPTYGEWAALLNGLIWNGIVLFLIIFPDGRFVPRWTVLPVLLYVFFIIRSLVLGLGDWDTGFGLFVNLFGIVSAIVSQIYRYHRVATPEERQQIKWMLYGLGVLFVYVVVRVGLLQTLVPKLGETFLQTVVDELLGMLIFGVFPICIGIAILRYRLWEVDLLINRTLVYTGVTVMLALVYWGSVVLLQSLFVGGGQSPLVIVLSTLAIAALFNPLRQRMQQMVDRRFYRRRYDAQQTLATFAASLRHESSANPAQITNSMIGAIEQTVQPAHVAVWLRPVRSPRVATLRKEK